MCPKDEHGNEIRHYQGRLPESRKLNFSIQVIWLSILIYSYFKVEPSAGVCTLLDPEKIIQTYFHEEGLTHYMHPLLHDHKERLRCIFSPRNPIIQEHKLSGTCGTHMTITSVNIESK